MIEKAGTFQIGGMTYQNGVRREDDIVGYPIPARILAEAKHPHVYKMSPEEEREFAASDAEFDRLERKWNRLTWFWSKKTRDEMYRFIAGG